MALVLPQTLPAQTVYLTRAEALHRAFPAGEVVRPVSLRLAQERRKEIERAAGVELRTAWIRCYQGSIEARVVGYACIDNVIGKERPITYLIRIDHPSGEIAFIEVMVYREAIGGEVRMPLFRRQFERKTTAHPTRLHEDIRNIAGATLSSRALADGSRKILQLYKLYLRGLPGG